MSNATFLVQPWCQACPQTTFVFSQENHLKKAIYIVNTQCKSCLLYWGSADMVVDFSLDHHTFTFKHTQNTPCTHLLPAPLGR